MLRLPDGRLGQVSALVLTLLSLAIVWLAAIEPVLDFYATRAETLAQQRLLISRMTAVADTLPALQGQEARPDTGPAADALLAGSSDAVAGARLQERIQGMASQLGVVPTSMEALPAQQDGSYRRIRLRVALSASWPVLTQLLAAISQARPRLLIDGADFEASPMLVHPAGLPLDATFTVLGFREGAAPVAGQ